MFDLFKAFGYDEKVATQGAKRMLGGDPEEYIILKRIPNPDYRTMLNKEYRANAAALDTQDIEAKNKLSDDIMAKVLAHTVVGGWGKKFGENGNSLKFSVEECTKVFQKYPEFRSACQAWAEDNANYQTEEATVEQVKKP